MGILESLNYNINILEDYEKKKNFLLKENILLEEEIKKNEDCKIFLKECKNYYTAALDFIYQESIGALKNTLDTALQYVIYDSVYETEIVLEDKRGVKTLNISLRDMEKDKIVDIIDGSGMGVATVISCVMKVFYLLNKDSKVLVLDEKYSAVSEQYVQRFMEFIREMCKEKGLILVLITHDPRLAEYADFSYNVYMGEVTKLETLSNTK